MKKLFLEIFKKKINIAENCHIFVVKLMRRLLLNNQIL